MNLISTIIASLLVSLVIAPPQSSRTSQQRSTTKPRTPDTTIVRRFPGVFVKDEQGNSKPLQITKLDVNVQITGTVATTTIDMTVYNPHNRVLEGEFSFPVSDGQTVSRFALDINGKLREAVVVSKTKGRETFEEVIRTKIDPALLEWTRDNSFRSRVYPLPPRGTRRLVLAFEQPLTSLTEGFGYTIPFAFPQPVSRFTFNAEVAAFGTRPSLTGGDEVIAFTPNGRTFVASIDEANITLNKPFTINVPVVHNRSQVIVQEHDGKDYVGIFLSTPPEQRPKQTSGTMAVYWDHSISGLNRDVKKELTLLEELLRRYSPSTVELVAFANTVTLQETFSGKNSRAMIERIQQLPMDGGTQLGVVPFSTVSADMAVLFSDGISTFGKHQPTLGHTPIYAVASSTRTDHAILRSIAQHTGGRYLNIQNLQVSDAVVELLADQRAISEVEVLEGRIDNLLPRGKQPLDLVTRLSGILQTPSARLRITTTINGSNPMTEEVNINAAEHRMQGMSIPRLWATMEIERLSADRFVNAKAIEAIGRQFSIVTPGTSLIVLERIQDYVRFGIELPVSEPELQQEYAAHRKEAETIEQHRLATHTAQVQALITGARQIVNQRKAADGDFWLWPSTKEFPTTVLPNALGSISGSVLTPGGTIVPNAEVSISGTPLRFTTGDDGSFNFVNVPTGAVDVVVQHPDFTTSSTTVITQSGRTAAATVRLAKAEQNDRRVLMKMSQARPSPTQGFMGIASEGSAAAPASIQVIQDGLTVLEGADERPPQRALDIVESVQETEDARPEIHTQELNRRRTVAASPVSREVWTDTINSVQGQSIYQVYLALRPKYMQATGFYLDVADALLTANQRELAVRVLSALAELQGEDSRTLRILAHRLLQLDMPELAASVFTDVLRIRDEEPQSYRDLGLALAACGDYVGAAKNLRYVVDHPWNQRFPEIELIAARELSRIAAEHRLPDGLVDSTLLIPYVADIRVVLTWDADNCDMDLWVIDPDGETCMYNNRFTKIGGRMSADLTGGYGPEEFVLPAAKKGAYSIKVHYYGSRQQTIDRPTTIQVHMYTQYGKPNEKHDAVTLRLDGVSKVIDIGNVLIN